MRSTGARTVDLGEIDALLDDLGCEDDDERWWETPPAQGSGTPGAGSVPLAAPVAAPVAQAHGTGGGTGIDGPVGGRGLDLRVPGDDDPGWPEPCELVGPVAVPAGYRLDGRQVLRYEADNVAVPGGRLVTLARRYRFEVRDGRVWVPRWLARRRDELAWVLDPDVGGRAGHVEVSGRAVEAVGVAVALWERVATVPYAVWAPELAADAMWDLPAVADALGVGPQTVSTYLARGQFPEPQARAGRSPLWSAEVVWRWHAGRPGQGRR